MAAHAYAFDQPANEDIGPHLLERVRGRLVQAQEGLDSIACLGRKLGTLERRLQRRDHVELSPPRNRRHLGQVDRAQIDRWPGQGADNRGRVARVGKHAQPGQRVSDLRPLKEGGVAGKAKRHAALLERSGHKPPLAPACAGDDADSLGRGLPLGEQLLDLTRNGLGLGAIVLTAPETHRRWIADRRPRGRSRSRPGGSRETPRARRRRRCESAA